MERLGLLGGTFDPPHLGHLILAMTCAEALALDAVWFVPAALPPHKQDRDVTPAAQRLAMLRLALRDNPRFAISTVDVDRPGPHYTADMLALVRRQVPQATLYFLMGGDSLHDLPGWRAPERLLAQARIAVVRRPGARFDVADLARRLPGLQGCLDVVDGPAVAISGTAIKARMAAGQSIRYLVPEAVRDYIIHHNLYDDPDDED